MVKKSCVRICVWGGANNNSHIVLYPPLSAERVHYSSLFPLPVMMLPLRRLRHLEREQQILDNYPNYESPLSISYGQNQFLRDGDNLVQPGLHCLVPEWDFQGGEWANMQIKTVRCGDGLKRNDAHCEGNAARSLLPHFYSLSHATFARGSKDRR